MHANPSATTRIEQIAIKRELALGLMSRGDRDLVLAFAALHFVPGRGYDEKAVNAVLADWLGDAGTMLRSDHVELRRWLVDTNWLVRDGFGHRYALAPQAPTRAAELLGDATAEALGRRVSQAREADAARRAERRSRHAASASTDAARATVA